MPPYLYALIGALVFAIAHGMHFTVPPLPGTTVDDTMPIAQVAQIARVRQRSLEGTGWFRAVWTHPDVRIADIGY